MSFTPVEGTRTHVLVDSWYHCQALRKTTRQRNFDLSGGLRNNRYLRVVREDGSREWVSLAKYGASLRESDWQVL